MRNLGEIPRWKRVVAAASVFTLAPACTFTSEGHGKVEARYVSPLTTAYHPPETAPRSSTTADTRPRTTTTTATTVYIRPAAPDTRPQPPTTSPYYRQMTAEELWASCKPVAGSNGRCDRSRFTDMPETDKNGHPGTVALEQTGEIVELDIRQPGQLIEVWDCQHFLGRFETPIDINACQATVRSAAKY